MCSARYSTPSAFPSTFCGQVSLHLITFFLFSPSRAPYFVMLVAAPSRRGNFISLYVEGDRHACTGERGRERYLQLHNLVSIAYSPLVPAARQGRSGDGICAVSAGSGLRASSVAPVRYHAPRTCVCVCVVAAPSLSSSSAASFVYPRDSGSRTDPPSFSRWQKGSLPLAATAFDNTAFGIGTNLHLRTVLA